MRPYLFVLAPLAVCLSCALSCAAAEGEEVVATVNGEPITREHLIEELLVRHGAAVLEDVIRERAVGQEMARARITVSEGEIDLEIERERRSFGLKGERLDGKVTEKYGMSMEGYRGVVRRWLRIRKLLLRRENPTDEDVMLWFYRNRERLYDTPAEYTVRHVFIAPKDPRTGRVRTDAEIQARISAVRGGILKGTDFGRLARKYSDDAATAERGGELGTVNERAARTHLEPNFVEAMVRLRPGQQGMVNTANGYHFIEVTAFKEGRQARYEDFRHVARGDHLEEQALLRREIFLRDLMERANVTRSFEPPRRRRPVFPEDAGILED